MITYPRNCEIWEDLDTGATFLVPEDCKETVLKVKKKRNIHLVLDFTANTREEMMDTFYFITGRGEYTPPVVSTAKNRTFDKDKGGGSKINTKPKPKPKPKLDTLEVVRAALNHFGSENYRRPRL